MSAIFPIAILLSVSAVWLSTSLASRKLRLVFLARVGDDPSVPYELREPGRDPEKFFYFFRKSTVQRLKADPVVWQLRERGRRLMILSAVVPVAGFFLFGLVAFVMDRLRRGG